MERTEWSQLKNDIINIVHPKKPIYRQIGWRNGRKLFCKAGKLYGHGFKPLRKNSTLGLTLATGDPEKMKRERNFLRKMLSIRRSTQWFDRTGKSFWKSLFGL